MIQFSKRFFLALLILFSLAACADDSENAGSDAGSTDISQPDTTSSGKTDTLGDADEEGEGEGEGGEGEEEHEIPSQITTQGASFEGVIPADSKLDLTLVANRNDTIVMWLRVDGDEDWAPEISIYPAGASNPLVFHKPDSGEDAHIPYQSNQIQSGFDFYEGDAYRLELGNQSQVEGRFKFSLECLAGPCDTSDPGDNGDNGGGDETDEPTSPGENPYAGMSDSALRAELKATHTANHQSLGYKRARDFMFEYDMDNVGAQDEVECVYSGRKAIIEGRIDAQTNHNYNTEHTWPQSRGASGTAKSDLHHLFVIDAPINSKRANYFFDYVVDVDYEEGGSKLGLNQAGETRFEVRPKTRGNVARAIFYFAVVYDKEITADEEAALRQWHIEDPVDNAERLRNDAVEGAQGNRNFFIDWPELIDQISDF